MGGALVAVAVAVTGVGLADAVAVEVGLGVEVELTAAAVVADAVAVDVEAAGLAVARAVAVAGWVAVGAEVAATGAVAATLAVEVAIVRSVAEVVGAVVVGAVAAVGSGSTSAADRLSSLPPPAIPAAISNARKPTTATIGPLTRQRWRANHRHEPRSACISGRSYRERLRNATPPRRDCRDDVAGARTRVWWSLALSAQRCSVSGQVGSRRLRLDSTGTPDRNRTCAHGLGNHCSIH